MSGWTRISVSMLDAADRSLVASPHLITCVAIRYRDIRLAGGDRRPYFALQRTWRARDRQPRSTRAGGDYGEVAATHSRCNWNGLHVGSRVVRCGLRAGGR